jgi:N-methylhydantoinase A
MEREIRIGIDIGGTFTDFVIIDPLSGKVETFKLLSTPANPAEAVLDGLERIEASLAAAFTSGEDPPGRFSLTIIHGSTVATNALLERKGARTALVATRGFRDVLEIGRQTRPALYDLFADPPPPLVPAPLRLEVDERVASTGEILAALDPGQVDSLLATLRSLEAESVAVCLLFSFLHPAHEQMIGERLRQAGWNVSLSSEILPEYREYERASTTAVNAYVSPILDRYLGALEAGLQEDKPAARRLRVMQSNGGHMDLPSGGLIPRTYRLRVMQSNGGHMDLPSGGLIPRTYRLRVMQSNGGHMSLGEARRSGVRCILSGPAGGIIGALRVSQHDPPSLSGKGACSASLSQGLGRLLTFDMGGTSTDVSLVAGAPQITTESVVGGCPIRIPVLDIHTIGAGGGSIAYVDSGGALRVGPQSAGADPGPACYARGDPSDDLPTVTDANLALGRLAAEHFLGGALPLHPQRAARVMARLGEALGLDPMQAALGVIEVVNAHMERALRLISVERGHDPAGKDGEGTFTLLSFGGAGGLHAASLARRLGLRRVLVPPIASTLSAYGMLAADVVKDYTQTVMLPGSTPIDRIASALAPLVRRGQREVQAEGIPAGDILVEPSLDMRYSGQSYELPVPWPYSDGTSSGDQDLQEIFHHVHQQAYGYARPGAAVEIVNLRVRATGRVTPPALPAAPLESPDPSPALLETRPVWLEAAGPSALPTPTPFYRYERLHPGNVIPGPAVIVRSDTTILIDPPDWAEVDPYHNLVLTIEP